MATQTSVTVQDNIGGLWQLVVQPGGQLAITQLGAGTAPVFALSAVTGGAVAFQISVLGGMLLTASVTFSEQPPLQFFQPGDGTTWALFVSQGGIIFTSLLPFAVGSLYPPPGAYGDGRFAYITPQQPGGPGTPVTVPHQAAGLVGPNKPDSLFPFNEHTGRFQAGCGHSFNSYEIIKAGLVPPLQSALVCCPICRFIQNVYTPYDLVLSQSQPLIIG